MDLFAQYPLMRFSFYASGRVQLLNSVATEAMAELDRMLKDDQTILFEHVVRGEELVWLWTLGAYEVVRTICQASKCFSAGANLRFAKLKAELAAARIPMAKMEKHRKKLPIGSGRSPAELVLSERDLLIGDPDDPKSFRTLAQRFYSAFAQLQPEDVLLPHEHAFEA